MIMRMTRLTIPTSLRYIRGERANSLRKTTGCSVLIFSAAGEPLKFIAGHS